MVLTILAILLVGSIAFFQTVRGLFNALVLAVLTLTSAIIAMAFYEPVAALVPDAYSYLSEGAALGVLFLLPLIGLRVAAEFYLPLKIDLGVWFDRIAGGLLGLISGMIMVGILLLVVQFMPLGGTILGYTPFDASLQRSQRIIPLVPDDLVVGMAQSLSAGAFKTSPPKLFADNHDNLLLELFANRNTAGANGRTTSAFITGTTTTTTTARRI